MSDYISRQAVLKLLSTMPLEEAMTKALLSQSVKQMDAAQPEQRWIPCSKRLPEARRSVILSTKDGWTGEGCYWETTEHHVIWKGYRWNATYWDDEVTAWKPLPEPWKGEEE